MHHWWLSINELINQYRWKEIRILLSWGWGNFHGVKILGAVCCLSVRFMEVRNKEFLARTEKVSPLEHNNEGRNGPDHLLLWTRLAMCLSHGEWTTRQWNKQLVQFFHTMLYTSPIIMAPSAIKKWDWLLTSGEDTSNGRRRSWIVRNDEMSIVRVMSEVSNVDDSCFLIKSPSTTIR